MFQPEKRLNVKLDVRVPSELRAKIEEYQRTQGMKTLSEATIDRIEKGFSTEVEFIALQSCEFRSLIPAHPDFINCKRGTRTITRKAQECLACQIYAEIRVPLAREERIKAKIKKANETLQDLLVRINNAKRERSETTLDGLRETNQDLRQKLKYALNYIAELKSTKAMESKPVIHSILTPMEENGVTQKVESNPQIIKRVVEEKKTTEEFMPSQEQKKLADILCPKTKDFVSVDDACKKCDAIINCGQYREFMILKRAIRNQ